MIYRAKCFNENETVNCEELEKLLKKVMDELEKRWNGMKFDEFETNVQLLAIACVKLCREREKWREKYMNLVDRYVGYLDETTEKLKNLVRNT